MPLVVLKLTQNDGFPKGSGVLTDAVNNKRLTAFLPREAYNKRWWVRSVNAIRITEDAEQLRWIEVFIPQLMSEERIHYFLGAEDVATPRKGLRFYSNTRSLGQNSFLNTSCGVNVTPNLNLGTHRLDELRIDVDLTAVDVRNVISPLTSFELILEYE